MLCPESIFKVTHGLGVDFWIEVDDFSKYVPDNVRQFSVIFKHFFGHDNRRRESCGAVRASLIIGSRSKYGTKFPDQLLPLFCVPLVNIIIMNSECSKNTINTTNET